MNLIESQALNFETGFKICYILTFITYKRFVFR